MAGRLRTLPKHRAQPGVTSESEGGDVDSVEVGDLTVAYRYRGSGPALLLLHGGLCDGRVWGPQLEDLSADHTVIAWDAPGCGRSSDAPESFRLPDYADCLAAFIQVLGLRRPHVLGHSWGSGLALELYRRHPDVPATLLLAGAYAGWAGSLPADEVARRCRLALEVADRLPDFDPRVVPGLFSEALPEGGAAVLAQVMAEVRPAATRAMALSFAEADLRDMLPSVRLPTLLLYGANDERAPVEAVGLALHAAIPASQLVVLPGLGHEAYLESPEVFDAAVRQFLRAHGA